MDEIISTNSVINQVLLKTIELAQAEVTQTIVIGALPADESISFAIGAGGADATFFPKSMSYELDIVVNGKSYDAEAISDALNTIHAKLTMATSYPSTNDWQITNISTISTPNYLTLEENGQFLYGSSIRVRFYFKKGAI
jgi:hypothetical protein